MKVIAYPAFDWLDRYFSCPNCGVLVEFEVDDLKGINPIKPKKIDGQWSVIVQCPVDGKVQTFREVQGG